MATPPAGWRQRSTNPQEYEAILDLGNFNKYEVNVNTQTGQRQIYTIDPILQTRSLLATVNANGSIIRNASVYNNIASLPNGQTRIKNIIDSSKTAANKIIGAVGTEEQKKRLSEQKEYAKLKSDAPSAGPGSLSKGKEETGPNSGASAGTGSGTPSTGESSLGVLRNVSNYNDTSDYGNFVYPEKINKKQDYMVIRAYNYKVADIFTREGGTTDAGILKGTVDISQRSFTEILGSVILPMPANISEANQTKWGSNELSSLTAGVMGAVVGGVTAGVSGDISGVMSAIENSAKDVFGKTAANTQIKQQLTLNAAASVVKKLGMAIDAESYRARVTGTVINPNLELLFNGPSLRSFQFQYKLAPRSETEARQIRGIIKFFKKAMAPKRSNKSNLDAFFLGAPNVFQIKFITGGTESKSLPTLKTCALVNFNVNYTADGFYAAYKDSKVGSQPISVQIDMTFSELTPVYNDHYDQSDSVGFKDLESLENPNIDYQDIVELENDSTKDQRVTPRSQNPNLPGAGTAPGSPVPPLVTGIDNVTGSNNRPPLAGTPGSQATGI